MNIEFCPSSVCMTWLLLATLDICMSNENFLWIDSPVLPNFQWNRWVECLTKTVLRRWGVTASFASLVWAILSLESLLRASSALDIIQVRALLSRESLLRANSALVLFECGCSSPSNRFIRPSVPSSYWSVGALVPRISLSGYQCLHLIFPKMW
jgi:hypothetical protein